MKSTLGLSFLIFTFCFIVMVSPTCCGEPLSSNILVNSDIIKSSKNINFDLDKKKYYIPNLYNFNEHYESKDHIFNMLDFNKKPTKKAITVTFFPTYDFSRNSDIEDYENDIAIKKRISPFLIPILKIKFPFF